MCKILLNSEANILPIGMTEEKIKKKLKCQFLFLVGENFSSSQDPSTIEYNVNALKAGLSSLASDNTG